LSNLNKIKFNSWSNLNNRTKIKIIYKLRDQIRVWVEMKVKEIRRHNIAQVGEREGEKERIRD
jgi:hypothetical protein